MITSEPFDMKKLFTIIFFLIPLTALTQNTVERYQYWFNSDTENMVSGLTGQDPGDPVYSFSATIGSDGLADGLHVLNMRFRDKEERWSPVLSRFFYKMPASPAIDATIDRVSYWFNNDVASATQEAVSGGGSFLFNPSVSAEDLPDGLHVLNLRFRDSEKKWSPVLSRFFYKMPAYATADAKVTSYSYWFNNDISNAVEATVPQSGSIVINEKFDASSLADGLHVFNIRFRDAGGKWSSTLSRFFYKMPVSDPLEENLVTAYRYWFNENDTEMFGVELDEPVNPLHLVADIRVPYLEPGEHTFSIQFLDKRKKWSPSLTETFEIEDCSPGYIDDPAGEAEVCGGTEHVYTVDAALNITGFEWSLTPSEAGTLDAGGAEVTVNWNEGFSGNAQLAVYGSNPCGQTETRSLTVGVVDAPFVTAMDDTSICEGESIELTVTGFNGTIEWNVPDPVVTPSIETTYTVTATNICGVAEDNVVIGVDTHPSLTVMDDIEICQGEDVELSAESDGTVTWSGGSALVSPAETTTYIATAGKGACKVEDEVTVTVNPSPGLTVMDDVEICEGDQVELTAQSEGSITWSVDNTMVSPSETTTYHVTASKDGCEAAGQVTVTVGYLPSLTVMDDISICEGEQVELSAETNGVLSWSGGEDVVAPARTTTYTATATNNCGTVDADVTVTVKPLPTLEVMDDQEICEGEELLLEAESDGVVTWSSGSELVAPSEPVIYTAFAEKNGCEVHKEVLVMVHPIPDQPVLEQVNETLVSSSESGNIWFYNNNELEGVTGKEYSPEDSGEYYVRVISTEGCISDPSNTISFTASNLITIGMSEVKVYPNPVHDQLFISPGLPHGEPFRIELLTLGGRVIMMKNITNESYINVAGLSPSVYILRISQGEESRVLRIVKN